MMNALRPVAIALIAAAVSHSVTAAAQTFHAPFFYQINRPRPRPRIGAVLAAPVIPGAMAPVISPMSPTALPVAPVVPLAPADAPSCAPTREVTLSAGTAQWTLNAIPANACALPSALARVSSAQEALRVRVSARSAVLLAADGALSLTDETGASVRLSTSRGACGPSVDVGVAVLDPGVYVLRAPGSAAGTRSISVESVPLGTSVRPEPTGAAMVSMSTGGGGAGPFVCQRDEGVDVRVLACPAGARATITAERGALLAMESASAGRTCYTAVAGAPTEAPVPAGRLVVLRAWPQGPNAGALRVSLR